MQTVYSSKLTTSSHKCAYKAEQSLDFYCEAVEIQVLETDYYTIISNSTINLCGYVYENTFIPFSLWIDSFAYNNNNDSGSLQFMISVLRQRTGSFTLVVITAEPNQQGDFTVIVSGPKSVNIKRIGIIFHFFNIIVEQTKMIYSAFVSLKRFDLDINLVLV